MGDALMQVLDIAEAIQAADEAAGATGPARTRAPLPVARWTARWTSRSSPRSSCPTARTPSARRNRSTPPSAPPRSGTDLHDRARNGLRRGHGGGPVRLPGHARGAAGHEETLAQIAEITQASAFDAPTAEDSRCGLRQPAVEDRFRRGGTGSHGMVRRGCADHRGPGCRAVRAVVRPPALIVRPSGRTVRRSGVAKLGVDDNRPHIPGPRRAR